MDGCVEDEHVEEKARYRNFTLIRFTYVLPGDIGRMGSVHEHWPVMLYQEPLVSKLSDMGGS